MESKETEDAKKNVGGVTTGRLLSYLQQILRTRPLHVFWTFRENYNFACRALPFYYLIKMKLAVLKI